MGTRCFAVQGVTNPDIGFAITVKEPDYEKAKELAYAGLFAWLGCENYRTSYFPDLKPDDSYWYSTGYAEPTGDLFKAAGIENYEILDCFDSLGDLKTGFEQIEEFL